MQAEPQLGLVYLRDCYPTLYVFVLEHFKMQDKAEEYMSECKKYENEAQNYTLYIFGYWLPWLNQQRRAGKLK